MRPTPPLRSRRRALILLRALRHGGLREVRAVSVKWAKLWVRRTRRGWAKRRFQSKQIKPNERPTAGVEIADPDLAVIVTSLNRATLLRLALRSVQLQDLDRWECIVVDDGSIDDSLVVAQSFAAVDPRFSVVRHDRNRGLSAARNTGMAFARAPLVCFLDDDDVLLPASLSSRLTALVGQPADVAGAYCDWIGIDPEDRLGAATRRRTPRAMHSVTYGNLAVGAPFISSSPLLRADVLRSLRGFDETIARAEDVDMWMRVTRAGYRFVYSNNVGIGYRRTPGSMVIGSPEMQFNGMMDVLHAADRPASSVALLGPNADHRPVSAAAFELAYAPQVLSHLALLSTRSVERAIAVGASRLSERSGNSSTSIASWRRSLRASAGASTATPGLTSRRHVVTSGTCSKGSPRPRRRWRCHRSTPAGSAMRDDGDDTSFPDRRSSRIDWSLRSTVLSFSSPTRADHVDELGPLYRELVSRGVKVRFMESPITAELTYFGSASTWTRCCRFDRI